MTLPRQPARIRLYPATKKNRTVVLRMVARRIAQILRWNTGTDEIEAGSWFFGTIQHLDVSSDAEWIQYAARGQAGQEWSGVSRAPFLKTIVESSNEGPWVYPVGFWLDATTVVSEPWEFRTEPVPFETQTFEEWGQEFDRDFPRRRDGWKQTKEPDTWIHQPAPRSPVLRSVLQESKAHRTFDENRFELEGLPTVLDEHVDSAAWDYKGRLIFSRLGVLHRMTQTDLRRGAPGTSVDLGPLEPPASRLPNP